MLAPFNKYSRGTTISANELHRIYVNIGKKKSEQVFYDVQIGKNIPVYNFIISSLEVIDRLILRAAQVESLNELKLKKSNLWGKLKELEWSFLRGCESFKIYLWELLDLK